MILGIIAALVCWIPFCNYWAVVPAIVGLVLGLVDVKQKKPKQVPCGMGVAGVVLNIVALGIIGIWTIFIGASAGAAAKEIENSAKQFDKNYKESQEHFKQNLENSRKEIEKANKDTLEHLQEAQRKLKGL